MHSSASRAYVKEFGAAMVAYAIVLPASIWLLRDGPSEAWWRIPLALAPVVPAAFCLVAFLRFFRQLDELQRRIQLEAFAFGFGGTALLTFSYGFLEGVGFPHLNWTFVWPVMAGLWLLGQVQATRRYQ